MRLLTESGVSKGGKPYRYVSYICGTYARNGKAACAAHIIYENVLMQLVGAEIRRAAASVLVKCSTDRVFAAAEAVRRGEATPYRAVYESGLEALRKQIVKLDMLINCLYEDKVTGVVPPDLFARQMAKYAHELAECEQDIAALERRVDTALPAGYTADVCFLPDVLDNETLMRLVDKIEIGQPLGGKGVKDVRVVLRYG